MVFKAAFYQIGAFHSRTADDWKKLIPHPTFPPNFTLTTVPLPHLGLHQLCLSGLNTISFLASITRSEGFWYLRY